MSKESHVFVNIGEHRKTIDAYVASQGLCQADVPALRAAARKFTRLADAEAALPAEKRERIQEFRRAESQRVLAAIAAVEPDLLPRRTITDVLSEALRKHLETLPHTPDVTVTFKDLSPDAKPLAR